MSVTARWTWQSIRPGSTSHPGAVHALVAVEARTDGDDAAVLHDDVRAGQRRARPVEHLPTVEHRPRHGAARYRGRRHPPPGSGSGSSWRHGQRHLLRARRAGRRRPAPLRRRQRQAGDRARRHRQRHRLRRAGRARHGRRHGRAGRGGPRAGRAGRRPGRVPRRRRGRPRLRHERLGRARLLDRAGRTSTTWPACCARPTASCAPETSLVFAVPHPMAAMLEGGEIVLRRGYGSGTRTTSDYFMAVMRASFRVDVMAEPHPLGQPGALVPGRLADLGFATSASVEPRLLHRARRASTTSPVCCARPTACSGRRRRWCSPCPTPWRPCSRAARSCCAAATARAPAPRATTSWPSCGPASAST